MNIYVYVYIYIYIYTYIHTYHLSRKSRNVGTFGFFFPFFALVLEFPHFRKVVWESTLNILGCSRAGSIGLRLCLAAVFLCLPDMFAPNPSNRGSLRSVCQKSWEFLWQFGMAVWQQLCWHVDAAAFGFAAENVCGLQLLANGVSGKWEDGGL